MKKKVYHRKIAINRNGRDWVVADIHANKDRLARALDRVNFDESKDRLFCTGDLIDYGRNNIDILDKLYFEDWFYAVRGNHEQMLIDRYESSLVRLVDKPNVKTQLDAAELHRFNGGKWFDKLRHETARIDIYNI